VAACVVLVGGRQVCLWEAGRCGADTFKKEASMYGWRDGWVKWVRE